MASENFFLNKFFNLQHHSSPCPIVNLTAKFCNILLNISRNRINGHVLWQIYYIAEKGERERKKAIKIEEKHVGAGKMACVMA